MEISKFPLFGNFQKPEIWTVFVGFFIGFLQFSDLYIYVEKFPLEVKKNFQKFPKISMEIISMEMEVQTLGRNEGKKKRRSL